MSKMLTVSIVTNEVTILCLWMWPKIRCKKTQYLVKNYAVVDRWCQNMYKILTWTHVPRK